MAVFKNGILGGLTGKIGPIIFAKWKGIFYAKSRPEKVKKKGKVSPAKLASQEKLSFLSSFLRNFSSFITVGFHHLATNKTELNAAFSANYHTAVIGEYPDLSIDFSQLKLSVGKLPGLSGIKMKCGDGYLLTLDWEVSTGKGRFDDQVILVLYAEELELADGMVGMAQRGQHNCTFQVEKRMKGKKLHVYLSMAALNRRAVSNSQYLGVIVS